MVIPARNIPLAPSVAALTNRIQQTFDEEIKIKPSDQSTFESFVSVFSGEFYPPLLRSRDPTGPRQGVVWIICSKTLMILRARV